MTKLNMKRTNSKKSLRGSVKKTRYLGNRVGSKKRTKNRRVSKSKLKKGGSLWGKKKFCKGFDSNKNNEETVLDFLLAKFTKAEGFSDEFKNIVSAFLKKKKLKDNFILPCSRSSEIDGTGISLNSYFIIDNECQGRSISMKGILEELLKGEHTFNDPNRFLYLAEYTEEFKEIKAKEQKLNELEREQNELFDRGNEQKELSDRENEQKELFDRGNEVEHPEIKVEQPEITVEQQEINRLKKEIDDLKRIKTIQAVKNVGTPQTVNIPTPGNDVFFESFTKEPFGEEPLGEEPLGEEPLGEEKKKEYILVIKVCKPK